MRQFRSDDTSPWTFGFGSGADGDGSINTSTDAPIDCACSGTSGLYALTATNVSFAQGQVILIHKTRGNTSANAGSWELNFISSYTAGTITTALPLQNTYVNSGNDCSQVLVMNQYNNLTINSGQTLSAKAWNGTVGGIIAYFAKGTCTITGNISANGGNGGQTDSASNYTTSGGSGAGFFGGYGRYIINNVKTDASQGEGTGGSVSESTSANGNGAGGGNVDPGGGASGGGGGGNGSAGSNGSSSPISTGGSASGNAALTSLTHGGGGGGAAQSRGGGGSYMTGGGGGGGGIIIIIAQAITITGSFGLSGGNGGAGNNGGDAGGGAGGSCLLKCKIATLGTNLITAPGGTAAAFGGAGAVGRIHLDYKASFTGSTTPTIDTTQDPTLDYIGGGSFLPFL